MAATVCLFFFFPLCNIFLFTNHKKSFSLCSTIDYIYIDTRIRTSFRYIWVIELNPDHRCLQRSNTWDRQKCFPPPHILTSAFHGSNGRSLNVRESKTLIGYCAPGRWWKGTPGRYEPRSIASTVNAVGLVSFASRNFFIASIYHLFNVLKNLITWLYTDTQIINTRSIRGKFSGFFVHIYMTVKWHANRCTYRIAQETNHGGRCT